MKTNKPYVLIESVNADAHDLSSRVNSIEQVLDNMTSSHGTGLLIAGSTGIGKTTFVKQLGKLLGMSIILVEAPHITEEHLINIPFITFKPLQGQKKSGSVNVDLNNFEVTLAKSHLATELKTANPIAEVEYLKAMQSADNNTKALFKEIGGEIDSIPDEIRSIRNRYKVILFLDEYFRQTSANVRNILRGILNGRIGNDKIPPSVYVVYASNLSDTGSTIEQIPLNADFKIMDFKAPTKDEFFHYFISTAEKNHIVLNPILIKAFKTTLNDSHISYDDAESGIRTSPRRWEQVLHYINAAIPVDTKEKASALLANIKSSFSNEESTSELHKLVDKIVRAVIAATGDKDLKDTPANEPDEWRNTLAHQIEMKKKLGNTRTYVPVVMGMPGIGKTAQMASIADDSNLRLISIDASTLSADDITGIPIPDKNHEQLAVKFADPALYKMIMADIKESTDQFMADPKVSQEKKDAFVKNKFKYLIFFDELNRVSSANVFNSLRRVILEKSFNDQLSLPDNAIIVAAMNPGDKGTAELTGHLKDAVDLIDAHPDWNSFISWVDSYSQVAPELKSYTNQAAKDMARKVLIDFVNTFTVKRTDPSIKGSTKFYIKIQDEESMYISPREYWTMYVDLVAGASRTLKKASATLDTVYAGLKQKLESTLKWIMRKHEIDSPHFLGAVDSWLRSIMDKLMVKQRGAVSLETMLDTVLKDPTKHLRSDQDFINYVQNFDLNKFSEEIDNYFEKLLSQEKTRYEALSKNTQIDKEKAALKDKLGRVLISKIEFIIKEVRDAAKANNLAGDIIDELETRIINVLPTLIEGEISDELWEVLMDKVIEIFSN